MKITTTSIHANASITQLPQDSRRVVKFVASDEKPDRPACSSCTILEKEDLLLTSLILRELKNEVEKYGGSLLVVFIPSVTEIEQLTLSPPYRMAMADIANKLDIDYLDLAPTFKAA